MTAVFGIFGWPVAHSLSPIMHRAALAALGLDAVYVPFPVPPEKLGAAVEAIRTLGTEGVNVTLPHKTAIIPLLTAVEEDALAIGAVNTVTRRGDDLIGANTDAEGLARALEEGAVSLQNARVVVLGAGGAARAAVVGLARRGAEQIVVAARNPERSSALVADLARASGTARLAATALTDVGKHLEHCTLLVQATSATLEGGPDAEAFVAALPLERLPPDAAVTDLVYRPLRTALLERAEGAGHRVVDGLGMLLHQGALAFETWTGHPAPLEIMRGALRAAL